MRKESGKYPIREGRQKFTGYEEMRDWYLHLLQKYIRKRGT